MSTTIDKGNEVATITHKNWKYRRRYLYAISLYLVLIILYPLHTPLDTQAAQAAVSMGIVNLLLCTVAYVSGTVIDDKTRTNMNVGEIPDTTVSGGKKPQFMQYTNWTYRRRYLYAVTAVLMYTGIYPIYTGTESVLGEIAVTFATSGLSALNAMYVFNAVFDDKHQLFKHLSESTTKVGEMPERNGG